MKKTRRRYRRESHVFQAVRLPAMMTEMMFSSFETIARRSWMLAQGKCSPTECARMVLEKAAGPRLVRVRIPEGSFRGVDIGSVPPWRDGKREALAPIRQPRASSRGVDAVVSAPNSLVPSPISGQGDANCESGPRTLAARFLQARSGVLSRRR